MNLCSSERFILKVITQALYRRRGSSCHENHAQLLSHNNSSWGMKHSTSKRIWCANFAKIHSRSTPHLHLIVKVDYVTYTPQHSRSPTFPLVVTWAQVKICWHSCDVMPEGRRAGGFYISTEPTNPCGQEGKPRQQLICCLSMATIGKLAQICIIVFSAV